MLHLSWWIPGHRATGSGTNSHSSMMVISASINFLCITREAPTPSPKIISISGTKNEPKTNPLYLLVLVMTIFPFLFCWWKRSRVSKACNRGASRLGEAWPRPRLGRKTYWHKDKARLTGTWNYIILLLKSQQGWTWSSWQLCCLARILGRSWRKGMASRQASKLQVDGNCSKTRSL